jgi:hypothetical protein
MNALPIQRPTAIITILTDMDAGQAFPTNYVSFATTGLALFLKKRWQHDQAIP